MLSPSRRSSLTAQLIPKIMKQAMNTYNHPQFYRQLGKEPQELITAALASLAKRVDLR